jgi:hypothetical protein
MKGAFLAAGSSFILFAALACAGGESLEISDSPQVLWDRAGTAMAALDSYHVAFLFPAGPEEVRWEAEFAAPDSYRFQLFTAEGETRQECASPPDGGVFVYGTPCREIFTSITAQAVAETVLVGDRAYVRQCQDVEEQCEPWLDGPRPQVPIAGPSPTYLPQWPLVALEMAQPVEVVGGEEIDGVTLVHLHGSVNHLRAIMENERRALTAAGITSFGEECTVEASLPGEPPGAESCRELTFEESLERQEPDLSFYDETPAVIDLWVSPDNFLVHRIALGAAPPPDEPGGEQLPLIVDYSRFNQIQIEAPQ